MCQLLAIRQIRKNTRNVACCFGLTSGREPSVKCRMIEYRPGNDLDLDAVIELYRASTLGERRPIDDRERFAAMFRNAANLVITGSGTPAS